jgi:hypothetical protein
MLKDKKDFRFLPNIQDFFDYLKEQIRINLICFSTGSKGASGAQAELGSYA